MNELTLADLDMGTCLPQILGTSKPTLDRRGMPRRIYTARPLTVA